MKRTTSQMELTLIRQRAHEALQQQVLVSAAPGFYGANVYDEQEIAAAVRVVFNQSPFRFYGRKCTFEAQHFEEEAAAYYGVKHACTTNSGSGALLLALHALDVGPGCEVVVPGYFWIAVSNAILLRGAIPVLCEIDDTLNMDPADLRRKIGSKTRAVVAVHMFGGQASIVEIVKICRRKDVPLTDNASWFEKARRGPAAPGSSRHALRRDRSRRWRGGQ